MREIKFRVWDKSLKRILLVKEIKFGRNKDITIITKNSGSNINNFELMQYTGLTDKNGKEIYEGDIINWINYNGGPTCEKCGYHKSGDDIQEIIWCPNNQDSRSWGWHHRTSEYNNYSLNKEDMQSIEVIGNIYENPELIGNKK